MPSLTRSAPRRSRRLRRRRLSLAQEIVNVGNNFRFDMSDQAPAAFGGTANQGEWAALQAFLGNGNVAATQQQLEAEAQKVQWS